jgi:CheY-like chemotaxis protein
VNETCPPPARILVVEDDASIQLGLRMNLEGEGYEVYVAEDGETGLERIKTELWDLVILDIMLPKLNGYELLTTLRTLDIDVPILVISARSAEWDKVMGLDLGAEDYVTKPFSVPELLARVRVALRRSRTSTVVSFGDVAIDATLRVVTHCDRIQRALGARARARQAVVAGANIQRGVGLRAPRHAPNHRQLRGTAAWQARTRPSRSQAPRDGARRWLPFGVALGDRCQDRLGVAG